MLSCAGALIDDLNVAENSETLPSHEELILPDKFLGKLAPFPLIPVLVSEVFQAVISNKIIKRITPELE